MSIPDINDDTIQSRLMKFLDKSKKLQVETLVQIIRNLNVNDSERSLICHTLISLVQDGHSRGYIDGANQEAVFRTKVGLDNMTKRIRGWKNVAKHFRRSAREKEKALREMEKQVRLSNLDRKTRLTTKQGFITWMEHGLQNERRDLWLLVVMVDLENFKWNNDVLSMEVGDRIIKRVAEILSNQIRTVDSMDTGAPWWSNTSLRAARVNDGGGDEFVLALLLSRDNAAQGVIERFDEEFAKEDWTNIHSEIRSIGAYKGIICVNTKDKEKIGIQEGINRIKVNKETGKMVIDQAESLMREDKKRKKSGDRSQSPIVKYNLRGGKLEAL
ncbi:GGDEF domain-containing protein [Candidatus Parcubacteria bacterium]|nr:GGDEF domain-containing protein [Candidatus Parcubacteria bacterium]